MTQRTDTGDSPLIESRDDLLSVFAGGEKAPEAWRIGTEHEKFVYRVADHRAPSYAEPGGIRDLLMGLTGMRTLTSTRICSPRSAPSRPRAHGGRSSPSSPG